MPPRLKQYLNRSILVSIPALYEDGKRRSYTLRGIEPDGLLLSSEERVHRLLLENEKSTVAANPLVFVPYAQITGIITATVTPSAPSPPIGDKTPAVSKSPPPTHEASKTVKTPAKSSKPAS